MRNICRSHDSRGLHNPNRVAHVALQQTHGVDVPLDQIMFLWLQHQVIASEGDDPRLPTASRYLRQTVRVQAAAGQHVAAAHLVALWKQHNAERGTRDRRRTPWRFHPLASYLFVSDCDRIFNSCKEKRKRDAF